MTDADAFCIRKARIADIEAMRALERRTAQKFRDIGYDYCADGPVRDADEHQRTIAEGVTLIIEVAGVLAGFAMIEPLDGAAHLVEIDIDPAHQGRGFGRRLIAAGEERARSKGFHAMTLTTYRDVPWNAPYYARAGFAIFDPGPERPGLQETIAREAAWGFALAPRVAMRKQIDE